MVSEKTISYLAIFISIMSAFISAASIIYSNKNSDNQIKASEKYNKLSVIPKLSSLAIFDSSEEFSGIGITNKGLGPAFIKNISYSIDGSIIDKPAYEAMASILRELNLDSKNYSLFPLKVGQIIKDEKTVWIFKSRKNSKEVSNSMYDIYKRANITICYCSLYDECQVKAIGRPIKGNITCAP